MFPVLSPGGAWLAVFLLIESLFSGRVRLREDPLGLLEGFWILFAGLFETTDSSAPPIPTHPRRLAGCLRGALQSLIIAWEGYGVSLFLCDFFISLLPASYLAHLSV